MNDHETNSNGWAGLALTFFVQEVCEFNVNPSLPPSLPLSCSSLQSLTENRWIALCRMSFNCVSVHYWTSSDGVNQSTTAGPMSSVHAYNTCHPGYGQLYIDACVCTQITVDINTHFHCSMHCTCTTKMTLYRLLHMSYMHVCILSGHYTSI